MSLILTQWQQYLKSEDYDYLVGFVNDTMNGVKRGNEYIVLCGDKLNNSTTSANMMVNDIIDLVGSANCDLNLHTYDLNSDLNNSKNKEISLDGYSPNPDLLNRLNKKLLIFSTNKNDYDSMVSELIGGTPFTWGGMYVATQSVVPGNVITIKSDVGSMQYRHAVNARIIEFVNMTLTNKLVLAC
jgi:hypothetical protein